MEEEGPAYLGVTDYIMFAAMLMVSAAIGIYFRFSGGKQKTTEEFLLAGKDMSILPVAFSLMASFLSAITVMGIPAEMYQFGINFAYVNIGFVIGSVLSAYLFLPVFFELQASTVYEYLERRFGRVVRTLTSIAFVFQMILYMSVVLYAPALALSAVTNLSTWVSVISIGVVCTFYCTLGGMKAVLWTDVFQALLMFIGLFTVLFKGFLDVGFLEVFRRANENGRIVVPGFEMDLTVRYTMLNLIAQGVVLSLSSFGGNQVQVQRLLTVKTLSRSRLALFISIPMGCGFHLLNCLAGIVIYSYYAYCDPMTSTDHSISKADQLLPYYMMSVLSKYPGLPGLCICGVFSASLSTVSSAVNSLSAVTMQDLVKPVLVRYDLSQKSTAIATQATTLFYGLLCIALTFLVATFGNLIQASLTLFGLLGGPVLAIFFLGMLTTRTTSKGAVVGLLSGIALSAWISFGAMVNAPPGVPLPVSLDGCESHNETLSNNATWTAAYNFSHVDFRTDSTLVAHIRQNESVIQESIVDDIFPLYKMSYMWFSFIGFGSAIIIGYVFSILTECISGKSNEVPEELLSPVLKYFISNNTQDKTEKKEIPAIFHLDTISDKQSKEEDPVQVIKVQRL